MDELSDQLVASAKERVGTTLREKYRLDRVIGIGGMATVYAATHRNKRKVAIKVLHKSVSSDATIRARFMREGYVANTIDHSGTVAVLDDDETADGAGFLVMELLEGETLDARRERKGEVLPAADVLSLMAQLLDVLGAAHNAGVIHRDIKPENLFLTKMGKLKVLDFGIARLHESKNSPEGHGTQAGAVLGTPGFMAPEQVRGKSDAIDARTDLWAVGATMYYLLTGRLVHEAETIQDELILAATVAPASLATHLPEAPQELVQVVDKALALAQEARFENAEAMRMAVRDALEVVMPEGPISLLMGSRGPISVHAGPGSDPSVAAQSVITGVVDPGRIHRSHAATTARPLAMKLPSEAPSPSRLPSNRALLGVTFFAVALAAASLAFVVLGRSPDAAKPPSAGVVPSSAASHRAADAASKTPASGPEVAPSPPSSGAPSAASATVKPVGSAGSASAKGPPPKSVSKKTGPKPALSSKPVAKPTHKLPPKPAGKSPGKSPFDRRFLPSLRRAHVPAESLCSSPGPSFA